MKLFNEIPVDLMVRYQFLPLKRDGEGHAASRWQTPTEPGTVDELPAHFARASVRPSVAYCRYD